MTETVAIGRFDLDCRGVLGVVDAEAFAREVMSELDLELEQTLPEDERVIQLQRVDLVLRIKAERQAVPQAIARVLAAALVEEVRQRSAGREVSRRTGKTSTVLSVPVLAKLAQRLALAEPSSAPTAEAFDREAGLSEGELERLEAGGRDGQLLETLGALVRDGKLDALAHWLTPQRALNILTRVSQSLGVEPAQQAAAVAHSRLVNGSAVAPVSEFAEIYKQVDSLPHVLAEECRAVLVLATAARLGGGRLCGSERVKRHVARALSRHVPPAEPRHREAATAKQVETEVAVGGAIDTLRYVDDVSTERFSPSQPVSIAPALGSGSSLEPRVVGEANDLSSPFAGLAFLIRPLQELGFAAALAAVHAEPTIVLSAVLRRIAELCELEPHPGDPALWVLAGLLAAPDAADWSDDELGWNAVECAALARAVGGEASSYAGVVEVWARAVIADVEMHFAEVGANEVSVAEVVAHRGSFRVDEERLVVAMSFPTRYEQLLRAGLLADVGFVPWLGVALVFVFEEET